MLQGNSDATCAWCAEMEQHGKTSGREKQLLKSGVILDNLAQTMRSSKFYSAWQWSSDNNGDTQLWPVDWQIDLGNHCNSACVFCLPEFSSRLAREFFDLGLAPSMPATNWTQDPGVLSEFIDLLTNTPNLAYLHFLGGETLITPGFETIIDALIERDFTHVAIGFTTNLTVWPGDLVSKLLKFDQVSLGMSIESLDQTNDYVRWPSKISTVRNNLENWLHQPNTANWYKSMRITPTVLTADRLKDIFEYAWTNGVNIESCNFIQEPEFFRIGVLPSAMRMRIAKDLESWLLTKPRNTDRIINTRNPDTLRLNILQEARSYITHLENAPDESFRLGDLMHFLKRLDVNRKQDAKHFFPHYADLFATAGY